MSTDLRHVRLLRPGSRADAFAIATSDQIPVVEIDAALVTALLKTDPREILNVPRLRFA